MGTWKTTKYEAIVVGVSSGGFSVLNRLLPELKSDFPVPLIIVRHLHPNSDDFIIRKLDKKCSLKAKEADEKESVLPGHIYFAPPNYHLLIEMDNTFSFSVSDHVNYARPSIDVLFGSASDVYREKLIGIILTGANNDGSQGLKIIKKRGGITMVQDPQNAETAMMPKSAIETTTIDYILPVEEMVHVLNRILE